MTTETTQAPLFRIDAKAIARGGEAAGGYLEKIGKFDLREMNEAQWNMFCQILVAQTFMGAIDTYVDEIGSNTAAPF